MVPDLDGLGILEGIEVEIGVVRKHESCRTESVARRQSIDHARGRDGLVDERDLTLGDNASILMLHLSPRTLYVTLANTKPGIPLDEFDSSRTVNVMESSVASVTFHVR